jgi:hypothetical protein
VITRDKKQLSAVRIAAIDGGNARRSATQSLRY